MKKIYALIFLAFSTQFIFAQSSSNTLLISAGKCWHGTGDLNGIIAGVGIDHKYNNRLTLSNEIATTINYGEDQGFNNFGAGASPEAGLLKFTTAGIQLSSVINYAIIGKHGDQLRVGAGPLLRFQSSSYPSIYGYTQDPNVYPSGFYTIYDNSHQNTFTIGYAVGMSFHTKLSSKYETGVKVFFQNDTNGDVITSISLLFGRSIL